MLVDEVDEAVPEEGATSAGQACPVNDPWGVIAFGPVVEDVADDCVVGVTAAVVTVVGVPVVGFAAGVDAPPLTFV